MGGGRFISWGRFTSGGLWFHAHQKVVNLGNVRKFTVNENHFGPPDRLILSYRHTDRHPVTCIISGDRAKRHSTSSIRPRGYKESDDDLFKPRGKHLRAPIMSTTDTEPEMKEFNLGPIGKLY